MTCRYPEGNDVDEAKTLWPRSGAELSIYDSFERKACGPAGWKRTPPPSPPMIRTRFQIDKKLFVEEAREVLHSAS